MLDQSSTRRRYQIVNGRRATPVNDMIMIAMAAASSASASWITICRMFLSCKFKDSAGYNSAAMSSDGIAPTIATTNNGACVECSQMPSLRLSFLWCVYAQWYGARYRVSTSKALWNLACLENLRNQLIACTKVPEHYFDSRIAYWNLCTYTIHIEISAFAEGYHDANSNC